MLTQDQWQLITQWQHAQQMAQQWSGYERQLRDHIVATIIQTTEDGTHYKAMGNGHVLKSVQTSTRTVEYSDAFAELQLWLAQNYPLHLDMFKYKTTLSKSKFDKALPIVKKAVEPFVTTRPSAAQLSVEPAK